MFNTVEAAQKTQNKLISWRRDLHQIPEVGLELPKTSAYVAEKLSEMGIEYQKNIGVSGIVGLIKGKEDGKTIAIRADMVVWLLWKRQGFPLLPQMEICMPAAMMLITAMLLGVAKLLNENKDKLKGNIKLIFQAGEEDPGGAKPMIDDGVMENPKVDAVLGLHIGTIFKEVGTGEVGVAYGNLMACIDRFEIKVIGKGWHGAMPDTGADPIVISAGVINVLQTIISREVKPTEPAVITIGQINGGRSYNIIPDFVEIVGTVRTTSQAVRGKIASRMEEIIANVTKGMRGDYELTYTYGYPPLVNDAEFTKGFVETAKKVVGEEIIVEITTPTMGGEDMAYFLEEAPGTFFFLGGGNESKGIVAPHHNSKFDVDEDVLWKGTALLAQGAVDWLAKVFM